MSRYHWVQMDVHIFLLRNYVTNHLVLLTILDYVVSEFNKKFKIYKQFIYLRKKVMTFF